MREKAVMENMCKYCKKGQNMTQIDIQIDTSREIYIPLVAIPNISTCLACQMIHYQPYIVTYIHFECKNFKLLK